MPALQSFAVRLQTIAAMNAFKCRQNAFKMPSNAIKIPSKFLNFIDFVQFFNILSGPSKPGVGGNRSVKRQFHNNLIKEIINLIIYASGNPDIID